MCAVLNRVCVLFCALHYRYGELNADYFSFLSCTITRWRQESGGERGRGRL